MPLLRSTDALALASLALTLGEPGQSGTPNLGTCRAPTSRQIWRPAGLSWGSQAGEGRQIWAPVGPKRDSGFGVSRAGPGGARPDRDAKSRHLSGPMEPLDSASRGRVLGEQGQSRTNLDTCWTPASV